MEIRFLRSCFVESFNFSFILLAAVTFLISAGGCGLGLGWIPYLKPDTFIVLLIPMGLIALGNGLFPPTQSTLLTLEAKSASLDLGRVMGAQEGYGALARIIGPIVAAIVWAETIDNTG